MEQRDISYQKLQEFLVIINESYWESINSEADTRKKIVDKFFSEILGWPEHEIQLESSAGKGFIDYRFTIKHLNRLIVEVKKKDRDLGLSQNHSGKSFKLSGSVFNTQASKEGIEQAIRYCGHKNAELACVTNGFQWFVFRANRLGDGLETLEGVAFCFGSLEGIKENFNLFYNLLSYEYMKQFSYRAIFQEAEGQPLRSRSYRSFVKDSNSKIYIDSQKIHQDLDRIMVSFFQDLAGNDDPEARRACFVTTKESEAVEKGLVRISEEIRDKIKKLENNEGIEIAEAIKRVKEMNKKELLLLVGTKGSGKSTFIDRFFADVLDKEIAENCVIIRVDLSQSGCDSKTILKWLDEHFLDIAETATFKGLQPTYDELVGMYWGEYTRWRTGTYKHLYDSDKNAFKIKFGEHLEKRREERPHEYIVHLLHRIVKGLSKVPCLVFDNADHFDVPFQEEVFKYAYSIYKESLCMVIVPITDTTSWQLTKEGAIQSFFTESFSLPTPSTELILQRRIDFIEEKIKQEKPQKSGGYFFGKGIPLTIDDIRGFTSCIQAVFLKTEQVANWIGQLSNRDIRRSLQLTREIITSPHIKIEDLLKSYIAKKTVIANEDDIKTAIIKRRYDVFPSDNSFVQNIYNLGGNTDTTPLLGVRILFFLREQWKANKDTDEKYISVGVIYEYFRAMGIEQNTLLIWLNNLLKTGLILSYNPLKKEIDEKSRVEISPSGFQHLEWGVYSWIYIEYMSEISPILSEDTVERIRFYLAYNSPYYYKKAILIFIEYLTAEDSYYCNIPKHDRYRGQETLNDEIKKQILLLQNHKAIYSGRYKRLRSKIDAWFPDKGFGFIDKSYEKKIYLNIRDFIDKQSLILQGKKIELDIVEDLQGRLQGKNIIIID